MTEITTDDLSAEDSDTPEPEQLEFVVTPPSNGHLALKSAPSRHILNFTQNHIQTGQLMFLHSGEYTFSIQRWLCLQEEFVCNKHKIKSSAFLTLTLFLCRCFIRWLSLPGKRRCECCTSPDLQHNCPLPGPHSEEKSSPAGFPRYSFQDQNHFFISSVN